MGKEIIGTENKKEQKLGLILCSIQNVCSQFLGKSEISGQKMKIMRQEMKS